MEVIGDVIRAEMRQENKEEIINAVADAWGQICPGYELICISVPKDDMDERRKVLKWVLKFETRKCKHRNELFCNITENQEKNL